MEEDFWCSEEEHDRGGEEVDIKNDGDIEVPGSDQLSFRIAGSQGGKLQAGKGAF